MTWSIVTHDPATGAFAVAVTTKALAVGASCPFTRAGVGAVSTQSFTNRYLGPRILDALAAGLDPQSAIMRALEPDNGRHLRQVHCVDAKGRSALWTGDNCVTWCGGVSAPYVSVAGNMLSNGDVVAATLRTFEAARGQPLQDRLLAGLDAGEAAGGDRRGRQSAAMVITTTEDFPDLDLRVDDNAAPITELRRLVDLWRVQSAARKGWAPSKANPSGAADMAAIEAQWIAQGLDLRFRR